MKMIKIILVAFVFFLSLNNSSASCTTAFNIGYNVAVESHTSSVLNCVNGFGTFWNFMTLDAVSAISDLLAFEKCKNNAQSVFDNTVDALIIGYDCCAYGC